jgi:GH43 family beta-xylosidase
VSDGPDDLKALVRFTNYHQRITSRRRTMMRKPRDIDAELKALAEKAKHLKERRVQQLGELVIATGADSINAETLAGALLVIAETTDAARKESWRKRGAAFFQSKSRNAGKGTDHQPDGTRAPDSSTASA